MLVSNVWVKFVKSFKKYSSKSFKVYICRSTMTNTKLFIWIEYWESYSDRSPLMILLWNSLKLNHQKKFNYSCKHITINYNCKIISLLNEIFLLEKLIHFLLKVIDFSDFSLFLRGPRRVQYVLKMSYFWKHLIS